MRSVVSLIALVVFTVACLTSCFDPEPAELSVMTQQNGRRRSCTVMVFNSQDKQIQEVPTDNNGVGYVKQLVPDTYTLKFKDISGNMYDAVVTVEIEGGDSMPMAIDLDKGIIID